jgi:hypothetical protein
MAVEAVVLVLLQTEVKLTRPPQGQWTLTMCTRTRPSAASSGSSSSYIRLAAAPSNHRPKDRH